MANPEHLAMLEKGVEKWNEWRRANPGLQPELEQASLRKAYLSGADLSGAHFTDAHLSVADLSGANLRQANLSYANLGRANLIGADLTSANLSNAYLGGADLRKAKNVGTAERMASTRTFHSSFLGTTRFASSPMRMMSPR
jgi:uncharacterized protein YjbI with pentapeptide repeats